MSSEENFTTKVIVDGNYTYVGKAARNASTANSVWQIKRVDASVSGTTVIEWAEGKDSFEFVMDTYAIYTYS